MALARRAVAKGVRTVRRRPAVERNWEVQYLTGDGPDRLRRMLVDDRPRVLDGVPRPALTDLLDRLVAAPDAGTGYAVDVLATLVAADA